MSSRIWLSTNYFLQYTVQGVFFQYWMVYLTTIKSLSVFYASIVFSMIYLSRFISGVFLSSYVIKKFGIINSYKIMSFLGFIVSIMYIFSENKIYLLFTTFLFGLTFFSLTPLIETTSSIFLKAENVDYGKVRVFGSFSFMLTGIFVGGVIGYFSNDYIYYIFITLVLIYFIFTLFDYPDLLKKEQDFSVSKNNLKGASYKWMKKDINAVLLILTFFFLQISHAAYNNYSVLYVERLNISYKWLIGFIVNISVIAEIVFFIFSSKFIKNINPSKLLMFSCGMAVLRWFMLGIFANVYIFSIMQVFHAITFALAQIAFILILNKNYKDDKILDMQNLYSAVGFQLSAFLGMYVVGSLWDISISFVFIVSSALAFISFIISLKINVK